MSFDHGPKTIAWSDFTSKVRAAAGSRSETEASFSKKQIYFGHLTEELAKRLEKTVSDAEIRVFRNDDFTPGFQTYIFNNEVVNDFNQNSQFRTFNAREIWTLCDLLDAVKDEVAECLGSPWALLSLKAWTTKPSAKETGPLGWHSDGFVSDVFKVMIYPVPLTAETGGFEFKDDQDNVIRHQSDRPGSWALFQNTEIIHRGVPGRSKPRTAIELTISRAASFDLRPRFPGINAHWPNFPWVGALDGCPEMIAQLVHHKFTVAI